MFEEMEMDLDALYLAFVENNLYDCIHVYKDEVWDFFLNSEDCNDNFVADYSFNFFPRMYCEKHKMPDKRELGFFKEKLRCTELLSL